MKQLLLTIRNCIKLRTFRYFKVLHNHVNIPINRIKDKNFGCFNYKINQYKPLQIKIGKCDNKLILNTLLLHEIGHLLDHNKRHHYHNYHKYHNQKKREKAAWKECIRLSNKYKIHICPNQANTWLSTYNTSYKTLENLI